MPTGKFFSDVRQSRNGSGSSQKRPRARRTSGILQGIDYENVIHVSDDDDDNDDGSKPPSSTQHHHTTRATIYGRADALYDARYHPMDDVTRPKHAAKVRGVSDSYNGDSSEEEEELDLPSGSGEDDTRPSSKRRRCPEPTRHSSRTEAHKPVNYKANVHPQDAVLRELGVIGGRQRSLTTPKDSRRRPSITHSRTGRADSVHGPSLSHKTTASPGVRNRSPNGTGDNEKSVFRYAEGWGVFDTKRGQRYFHHEAHSFYRGSAAPELDGDTEEDEDMEEEGDDTDGHNNLEEPLAKVAGMTDGDNNERSEGPETPEQQEETDIVLSDPYQENFSSSSVAVGSDRNMRAGTDDIEDIANKKDASSLLLGAMPGYVQPGSSMPLSQTQQGEGRPTKSLQAVIIHSRGRSKIANEQQETQETLSKAVNATTQQPQGESSYESTSLVASSSPLLSVSQWQRTTFGVQRTTHEELSENGSSVMHFSSQPSCGQSKSSASREGPKRLKNGPGFQIHEDSQRLREVSPTDAAVEEFVSSFLRVDDLPKENLPHNEEEQETSDVAPPSGRSSVRTNDVQAGHRSQSQRSDQDEHNAQSDAVDAEQVTTTDMTTEKSSEGKILPAPAIESDSLNGSQDVQKSCSGNFRTAKQLLAAGVARQTLPSTASTDFAAALAETVELELVDHITSDERTEIASEDEHARVRHKSIFGPSSDSPSRELLEDNHKHVKDAGFVNSQE